MLAFAITFTTAAVLTVVLTAICVMVAGVPVVTATDVPAAGVTGALFDSFLHGLSPTAGCISGPTRNLDQGKSCPWPVKLQAGC